MSLISSYTFVDDHTYTLNTLLEELALLGRHLRDGSVHHCRCVYEKHLPLVAGLASEGYVFATSPVEKRFMALLRNKAKEFLAKIKSGEIRDSTKMAEVLNWAREARHSLDGKNWGSNRNTYTGSSYTSGDGFPGYSQSLKRGNPNHIMGETVMVRRKEVLGVNAAQWIAKGASMGYEEIDKATGRRAFPVHLRPSTWLNIGVGLVTQLVTLWKKIRAPWDLPLIVFGSQQLTMIVDYAAEALSGGAILAARVRYTPQRAIYAATYPAGNSTVQVTPLGTAPASRYTIVA